MAKTGRERLRDYCTRHGYKQYELASLLEVADAHLSQLLSGVRSPGLLIAVRIEEVTGIPVESWVPSRVGRLARKRLARVPAAEIPSKEI